MTDYTKLVEALRGTDFGDTCVYCEYSDMCNDDDCIILQAADAIEALQAQLPKRGKWITIRLNNGGSYTGCSCCEAPIPTDTMLDYIPESESKYCYSCGANMEVQE